MNQTLTTPSSSSIDAKEKQTLTLSQALLLYLSRQKVELFNGTFAPLLGGVWGIFGHGNIGGVAEALYQYRSDIPYLRGQNEQAMGHAAIAYAKTHRARRVMAVTTSVGPGATNLLTAAAVAHTNRLPVLFLVGDLYHSRRPDPVLQQLENDQVPSDSVNDCFRPVSRYWDRLTHPQQLIQTLPQVVRTLLDPAQRGPVTLCLPQDTQTAKFEFPSHFFDEQLHRIQRPRPDSRQLCKISEILSSSQRPLIIAGGGVHYSGAEEALRCFAEAHYIPVVETQAGKTSLPWGHPLNLGAVGVLGTESANRIARSADCILCIGTRLSDFTTASKSLFHKKNVPLLGINTQSHDAWKCQQQLVGDALVCLQELHRELRNYQTSEDYSQEIKEALQDWEKSYQDIVKPQTILTDPQVVAAVNAEVEERDIVLCAAGGLPGELTRLWRSTDPVSFHLEYGYSCMGYEIAGGLGAKLADPKREVYVMVGDGSYLMMHSELLTAMQLGIKINVILVDNGGFGCIHRLQKSCGSPPFGNLFSLDQVPRLDFVANARSYGCHTQKASSIQELRDILRENKMRKEVCVTVIETSSEYSSPGSAWWDVSVAEQSELETVQESRNHYEQQLRKLREQ